MLDTGPESEKPQTTDRLPQTVREKLLVNFRPQPAIPAVAAFFFLVLLPVMSQIAEPAQAATSDWLLLLVTVGIISSCGLAVAAGFCSLFPQIAWFVLAGWSLRFAGTGALPVLNEMALLLGMVTMLGMFLFQTWRVYTGKFVATIRVGQRDPDAMG